MIRVCVATGSRSEYHLLVPLLKRLAGNSQIDLRIAVTGSHLSSLYGDTCRFIEQDGFSIDVKIPILQDKEGTPDDTNKAIARALVGFSSYWSECPVDVVVLLGDRYELLAAAVAATNLRIPIAHIHGGETTEGAVDEAIRHSITKMAYLHFVSCEQYRKRVIQLGEDPRRVYNVGALGVENIRTQGILDRRSFLESINADFGDKFALATFHPVTLEDMSAREQIGEMLAALDSFPEVPVLFTKSNSDAGGQEINEAIVEYVERRNDCVLVGSLGMQRYLSALRHAEFLVGNSSSGILESPSFGVPTVNIGDRQKGRIQAANILNCALQRESIKGAISKALSEDFRAPARSAINPYGDGHVSERIEETLVRFFMGDHIDTKKQFYDVCFDIEAVCSEEAYR